MFLSVHLSSFFQNFPVFSAILARVKRRTEFETAAARQIVALIVATARTAPKTRGVDNLN
jgi:hypothetical protein